MSIFAERPSPEDYEQYYAQYVGCVPDGDTLAFLTGQVDSARANLAGLPAEKENYRYAPEKWSLKEVIGHIVDTEWVFTGRALRFARNAPEALPGVDQDVLMRGANFEQRSLNDLLGEWGHLRAAGAALIGSFDEEILARTGIASNCRFTVRALVFVIAGHAQHHLNVISERYLV